jgi:acyl-coenzyme A synthetase/AMP-(fatty) acid ligase/acyl carrier protein
LWRCVAPHVDFVNGYGPTETTVNAAAWRLDEDVETLDDVPIGQAVANARVYLLDRRLEPVPIGVAGEIFIGGKGVARGYVARPDLTADRFVPDPYGPPGARLYRTGDLARRGTNGALIFVGRADTQVKIRGFRIELGEIESALLRVPNIRAAAVAVRGGSSADRQLVAFVAAETPDVFDGDVARTALRDSLPDYMIPSVVVALPELPLNANGKIDRKALPDLVTLPERTDLVAPDNETERAVCEACSQALGVDRVSALDNFFAIGGHSLAVMQMATRLSQRLGATIPLALVYQTETLRELASAIDAAAALRAQKECEAGDEEFEEFEL